MKITPLDLRKPDLKRVFKGYDVDEVRQLLSAAADSLEESLRENLDLKNRLTELNERLKNYQNMESTLNETLIMAQKAGEASRQAAQRESELIVAKAEVESERLLDETRARLRGLKIELERLEEERQTFLVKMRSLIASQWRILQEESGEAAQASQSSAKVQPEPYRRENDFSEGYFDSPSSQETPVPETDNQVDEEPPFSPAVSGKPEKPAGNQSGDGLEGRMKEDHEDSVTNLSRKLGEFLRARESLRDTAQTAESAGNGMPAAGEGEADKDAPLGWGREDKDSGRPDVFWGQSVDESEEDKGKKGGRKK